MQCGQGKPFTVTSTNPKMGGTAVRSYEKGGVVIVVGNAGRGKQGGPTAKELTDYERKENRGVYTVEKGQPPQDMDMMTSLTPAQRKAAEARMKAAQGKKK